LQRGVASRTAASRHGIDCFYSDISDVAIVDTHSDPTDRDANAYRHTGVLGHAYPYRNISANGHTAPHHVADVGGIATAKRERYEHRYAFRDAVACTDVGSYVDNDTEPNAAKDCIQG
jgi:hypothetical protein